MKKTILILVFILSASLSFSGGDNIIKTSNKDISTIISLEPTVPTKAIFCDISNPYCEDELNLKPSIPKEATFDDSITQ